MAHILVGTTAGLAELDGGGRQLRVHHEGRSVGAVAGRDGGLFALVQDSEVWRTVGDGRWVRAGALTGRRGHCIARTHSGVLVGTSEAHLLRLADDGLEVVHAFDHAPGRGEWYTPWGGPPDTRSISEDDSAVYVKVHVGGILRSTDGGDSWQRTIDLHADVHQVWTGRGRIFAACGAGGLAVSADEGRTWTMHIDGLHATYCRAGALSGDIVLVSASTGPGGRSSAIYRCGLDGTGLERCRRGLPEWFDQNIDSHCLDALPDDHLAAFATGDGRIFASDDGGASWAEVASGLPEVRCLLVKHEQG